MELLGWILIDVQAERARLEKQLADTKEFECRLNKYVKQDERLYVLVLK
jgi:hypothetical protein